MWLLVDVGNSRLKWGLYDSAGLSATAAREYRVHSLSQMLDEAWGRLDAPSQVWLVNVAGKAVHATLGQWVSEHWDCSVRQIEPQAQACGVLNGYTEPARLGSDRWAAMVGSHVHHPGPTLVADCGTAVTVDMLDAEGRHLGGWIIPGLTLMRAALIGGTEGIANEVEGVDTGEWLGRSTTTAMAVGGRQAVAGLLRQGLRSLGQHIQSRQVGCLLTGGDAEAVAPLLDDACRLEPDLVLLGLAELAKEMVQSE